MREWIEPPDVISIHAPRMGSDCPVDDADAIRQAFQSTLPGWGATARWPSNTPCVTNFNPRSPDGERLPRPKRCATSLAFQSTLPGWGATKAIMAGFAQGLISIHAPRMGSDVALAHAPPVEVISIHAPRMGSDMFCNMPISECASFQSTLPGWGAT